MTDKQIIIDVCPYQGECSVSGCKRNDDGCFVRQLFEERNRAENRIVELNKSIQAKEQECEAYKMEAEEGKEINAELKAELTRANCQIADDEILQCDMREAIEELKAENEGLKEEIKKHNDDMFKNPPEKRFYCKGCTLPYISKKQSKTLIEIKEIAKYFTEKGLEPQSVEHQLKLRGKEELAKIILQKISECEVENN